ncbi:MAG: GSCFA domain-containing protein [Bacteroidetes bacterium]|nr:GSCFA domain-containing protein [Bacteroidota bacterium]
MNFHLQFPIHPFPQKINYSHSFVFIGSCFSENISEIMNMHKFNVVENSHGVLYNPASIAVALRRVIKNDWMTENELFLQMIVGIHGNTTVGFLTPTNKNV